MMMIFSTGFLVYFIVLYNFVTLKGNILIIGVVFGCAEVLGIFFSERLMSIFDPVTAFIATDLVIMVLMMALKTLDLTEMMIYAVYLTLVFFVGIMFNLFLLFQNTYLSNPEISNMSLELNYTVSQTVNLFSPIIAIMDEPYPTMAVWVLSIIQIICLLRLNGKDIVKSMPDYEEMSQISNEHS